MKELPVINLEFSLKELSEKRYKVNRSTIYRWRVALGLPTERKDSYFTQDQIAQLDCYHLATNRRWGLRLTGNVFIEEVFCGEQSLTLWERLDSYLRSTLNYSVEQHLQKLKENNINPFGD